MISKMGHISFDYKYSSIKKFKLKLTWLNCIFQSYNIADKINNIKPHYFFLYNNQRYLSKKQLSNNKNNIIAHFSFWYPFPPFSNLMMATIVVSEVSTLRKTNVQLDLIFYIPSFWQQVVTWPFLGKLRLWNILKCW